MSDADESLRIIEACRVVLRDPRYTPMLSTQLIGWLRHPNAAVVDLAGRCLLRLGGAAIDDLWSATQETGVWSAAIWVLTAHDPESGRLIPFLRSHLADSTGEFDPEFSAGFAYILIERRKAERAVESADVDLCFRSLRRCANANPSSQVRLREFIAVFDIPA